jgi:hypothetical protein
MSYFDQLETALVEASARHQPSGRRRLLAPLAAAAAVLALVVGGVVVSQVASSPPAEASSVQITHEDGWIQVRLQFYDTAPATVARDLREAGFDVRRFKATTGPSRVNKVVSIGIFGGPGRGLIDQVGFEVPEGWDGSIQVVQGVATPAGEEYSAPSDAFDEGEPLACLEPGGRVDDVLAVATRLGLTVTWTGDGKAPAGDRAVVRAGATSPSAVTLSARVDEVGRAISCDG